MSHVLGQDVDTDKETGDARDELHKVLLIGDSGVGKTCLMQRFVRDKFDEKVSTTIGVDFAVKKVGVNDGYCKLTIWDTAGQERFRTLTSTFYRGARGVILVYDVTSRESFESLEQSWLPEVKQYCNMRALAMVVVANKVDKSDERQVSWEEGSNLARRYGCLFVETSAKANLAVALAFEELALQITAAPSLDDTGNVLDLTGGRRRMLSSCTSCMW